MNKRWSLVLALAFWIPAAMSGLAQETPQPAADASTAPEPDYLDDRSSAPAVIRSLYNAVNRREYVRAWSYFRDEPDRQSFESFAKGYAGTASVAVKLGKPTSEGAAGSVYTSVPVAIRSVDTKGKAAVFAGCYELRLVQPGVQAEPPFRPLGIVKGRLEPVDEPFETAGGTCPAAGLR